MTAQPKVYPFTFCAQIGCVVRLGFTAEEVEAMKKGANAVISIVPFVAPDQNVTLNVSLKGFTAGLEAVDGGERRPPMRQPLPRRGRTGGWRPRPPTPDPSPFGAIGRAGPQGLALRLPASITPA
jgi:hypothetical protein